jgi:hypothetical protein
MRSLEERDIELALSDIGHRLDYPTRDLWPDVRERIAARRRSWWLAVPLAPVAVTLAVILVMVLALSPAGIALAQRVLGLPGVQIYQTRETPSPAARPSGSRPLALGIPTTLEQARREGSGVILAPTDPALGAPDEVYIDNAASTLKHVILVYRSRPGIPVSAQLGVSAMVVEFLGTVDRNVMGKVVGPDTTLEQVSVDGAPGYWLAGAPHQFFYRDSYGNFVPETLRLAGNTLIWERDLTIYRLEAQVSKEEALRIAASFR